MEKTAQQKKEEKTVQEPKLLLLPEYEKIARHVNNICTVPCCETGSLIKHLAVFTQQGTYGNWRSQHEIRCCSLHVGTYCADVRKRYELFEACRDPVERKVTEGHQWELAGNGGSKRFERWGWQLLLLL